MRAKKVTKNLWAAAKSGDNEMLTKAIAAGAQINALGPEGYAAIHTAVTFGHIGIIQELLQSGANVRRRTADGFNSVHLCLMSSNIKLKHRPAILSTLLDHGGSPSVKSPLAGTPLQIVKNYRRSPKLADLLKQYGADV